MPQLITNANIRIMNILLQFVRMMLNLGVGFDIEDEEEAANGQTGWSAYRAATAANNNV